MTMPSPSQLSAIRGPGGRKRVAASVLFTDEAARVLLVQPASQRFWELPGGRVEEGESPRDAARRSLAERLAIDTRLGPLLVVDWVPPAHPRSDGLMLLYDGGTLDDASAAGIRLRAGDLNAYGFVDLEETQGLIAERLERRVAAALHGRRLGRPVELEDARPIGAARMAEDAR
jgi:8-oxo-dGTP diphosphatase